MPAPILATTLYALPHRPLLVPRLHLLERLNEGLHRRLTLSSVPAGFGKTTLGDSHAAGRWQPDSHSLTSVVLPKPAGAETSVSLPCWPPLMWLIKRGRMTILGREAAGGAPGGGVGEAKFDTRKPCFVRRYQRVCHDA